MATHQTTTSALGLNELGIDAKCTVFHNMTYDQIAEHEERYKEGVFTANGTFAVDTGKFTGRSPNDKFIVRQEPSAQHVDWGKVNQPTTAAVFDTLYAKATAHFSKAEKMYVFDGYCGANENSRLKVRIITELAWQHHFVTNMFMRPEYKEVAPGSGFAADFTIVNACNIVDEDWQAHGLKSEVFVIFNIEKKMAVIGGTFYGGEMKKGIFSMMNYYLPLKGIMPMHASANKGPKGDTAIFFGLSGTGKTTLSADPKRALIGDDEHGWDDAGIFNFEGGCYAKTINLSAPNEPEIYAAIRRDAMLENVWLDSQKVPDYYNIEKTENGRVSYPLYHISNHEPTSAGGHPAVVIFLTCDAYGVLPPVSKLTPGQAQYHFLSGYTAKVAGTERGITEPQATFSACFGAAFMTQHPIVYADLLKKKIEAHGTRVYLVNTGWTGGAYGVGSRMSLKYTRKCIDAILDGSIEDAKFEVDPIFAVAVPTSVEGVPSEMLNPALAWADKAQYKVMAKKLATEFRANFTQYVLPNHTDYSSFGPNQA
ncbi:phosphoenolpyruvate carboxykinase (ATP) [Saprolegnia diclina VS20]|uniref:phosphoenolpyruvate carboxykinase (ATP) n=1 Tax=Saprolegnia diclina (strain VS20) TaxID=1156394 RepID=T0SFK1_SAPDV|nr:phosphoenolpyruvate carboxykinase (ATP) [Saprolegnia diclina VS20]EQC41767.1 phosphoenolpyruvate carboxykinase (ATP) [Saprolegnia diclina VS20]|eukprot:XP_008604336.1 phosphoenolpyruvate carboxykinase (ATP) [Saprolegnia diclina VS20]